MKKGLTIIAGGLILSAGLFSCNGGGADAAKTAHELDSLAQRVTFVGDSVSMAAKTQIDSLNNVITALNDSLTASASAKPAATHSAPAKPTAAQKKAEEKKVEEKKVQEVLKGSRK